MNLSASHPDIKPAPIAARLRIVADLPGMKEERVRLDLFTHAARPDPDGFHRGDATLLQRDVFFVLRRGSHENRDGFDVHLRPDEELHQFMSVRTSNGTVVAMGEIRRSQTINIQTVRVPAGAVQLLSNRVGSR